MSMLEDFFCGNIYPAEEPVLEHEDYAEVHAEVIHLKEELQQCLTEEEKELLE